MRERQSERAESERAERESRESRKSERKREKREKYLDFGSSVRKLFGGGVVGFLCLLNIKVYSSNDCHLSLLFMSCRLLP